MIHLVCWWRGANGCQCDKLLQQILTAGLRQGGGRQSKHFVKLMFALSPVKVYLFFTIYQSYDMNEAASDTTHQGTQVTENRRRSKKQFFFFCKLDMA